MASPSSSSTFKNMRVKGDYFTHLLSAVSYKLNRSGIKMAHVGIDLNVGVVIRLEMPSGLGISLDVKDWRELNRYASRIITDYFNGSKTYPEKISLKTCDVVFREIYKQRSIVILKNPAAPNTGTILQSCTWFGLIKHWKCVEGKIRLLNMHVRECLELFDKCVLFIENSVNELKTADNDLDVEDTVERLIKKVELADYSNDLSIENKQYNSEFQTLGFDKLKQSVLNKIQNNVVM